MYDASSPLPVIDLDRILTEPLPPVDWLVEPILVRGDRAVWFGAFGSFKSWLLLHLALHLATGRDWLGFPVARPLRVLYIDEEMNQRTLRRRVKRLAAGLGIEPGQGKLALLSRVGVTFTEMGAVTLLSAIDKTPGLEPEVVIVEALRRVLVGSENKAEDIAQFWRNIEPLIRRGLTFLMSHHFKKPQGGEGENGGGAGSTRHQASGSTDILAGSDAGFGVKPVGEKDHLIVECVKLRDAEIARPFGVHFVEAYEDGPIEMRPEVPEPPLDRADEVRRLQEENPGVTGGAFVKLAMQALGLSRASVYRSLRPSAPDTGK